MGLGVLHLFAKTTPLADADEIAAAVKRATAETDVQVVPVAMLGHKADLAFMALGPDLWVLRRLQTDLGLAGLDIIDSYVSLTEISEYAQGVPDDLKQARLWPQLKALSDTLPLGYRIEIGGATESSAKAQASIKAVLPLALGVILVLLMVQLHSMKKMALVLATAPLGMIGVSAVLAAVTRRSAPPGFDGERRILVPAGRTRAPSHSARMPSCLTSPRRSRSAPFRRLPFLPPRGPPPTTCR